MNTRTGWGGNKSNGRYGNTSIRAYVGWCYAFLGLLCGLVFQSSALAQDYCTIITVYTGRLINGQACQPVPFQNVCLPSNCDEQCMIEPWFCYHCAVTDSQGFFSIKHIELDGMFNDTVLGHGGRYCVSVQRSCGIPYCGGCGIWDCFVPTPCPPPHLLVDTFPLGEIDLESLGDIFPPSYPSLGPSSGSSGPADCWFAWDWVPMATSYQIQIDTSAAHSFTGVLWRDTIVGGNGVEMTALPGRVWWRVRSIGSCGRSQWSFPATYTDVPAGTESEIPRGFYLSQNYPNPFNAGTVVRFGLETPSQWTLTIHNVMGQVIRTLAGFDGAGPKSIEWDGNNESREAVPSGVYFYRLKTANWSSTKKMTLLR